MLDQFERYRISDRYGAPEPETFEFKRKPKKVQHHFNYTQLEHHPDGAFVMPPTLSFGDYDNSGTIERSNYRVFKETFAKLEGREWWEIGGGHGQGIVVRVDADERHEDLREFFDGLEGYPIADESDFSEMEMEQESENWRDYGEREIRETVVGYAPKHLQERVEKALEGEVYSLYRGLSEATNSYPEHEGTSTIFHEESVVWQTIAKMDEDEWPTFIALLEDENTKWEYGGNGFKFLRDLYDRKLSPDEIAALAWGYGLPQFRNGYQDGLTRRFREYWNSQRYIPNPNPPPNLIQSPDLTDEQKEHLERVYQNLQSLSDEALTALFWQVLRPAWDANHESYQHAYQHRWDRPPDFNFHWMNYQFAQHAFDTAFVVMLDALTEGSFDVLPQFVPTVTEWFRPAPR